MARPSSGLLVALLAAFLACTTPRTQIILLIETDLPQGPSGTLTHVRVSVAQPNGAPRQRLTYRLGGGATGAGIYALPGTLGISALDNDGTRSVEVKVDAVSDPGGPGTGVDPLFTYTAIAPFEEERTLLMPVFLAGRCRTAPRCEPGFTCGRLGCERIQRTLSAVPADFSLDAGAADVTAPDAAVDDLAATDATDASSPDATALDAADASAPDATDASALDALDASDAADASALDASDAGDASDARDGTDAADATDAAMIDASDAADARDAADAPSTCTAPFSLCGTACVNTSVNPLHCGACGFACPPVPNATVTCGGGTCRFTCSPGFVDCDANPANGCELHEGDACTSPSGCAMGRTACSAGAATNYCDAPVLLGCGLPCLSGPPGSVCDGLGACRPSPFACDGGATGLEAGVDRDGGIVRVDGGTMIFDGSLMK
ncbi:MAG: hypothetical protein U0324_05835 [Polyangiales bacterium]